MCLDGGKLLKQFPLKITCWKSVWMHMCYNGTYMDLLLSGCYEVLFFDKETLQLLKGIRPWKPMFGIKDLVSLKGSLEMFVTCSYIMDFSVTMDASGYPISSETSKSISTSELFIHILYSVCFLQTYSG